MSPNDHDRIVFHCDIQMALNLQYETHAIMLRKGKGHSRGRFDIDSEPGVRGIIDTGEHHGYCFSRMYRDCAV